MTDKIQLGKHMGVSGSATAIIPDEERLKLLETNVARLFKMLDNAACGMQNNKSEIPIDTTFIGKTKGITFILQRKEDGYHVGERIFQSLSSAAEAVSGCRRSGWTFWRLTDGRTAKEVFKR